jgi:hypothetical protein
VSVIPGEVEASNREMISARFRVRATRAPE